MILFLKVSYFFKKIRGNKERKEERERERERDKEKGGREWKG